MSDKTQRSWKEIAMDVVAEKNHLRFEELIEELNQALAAAQEITTHIPDKLRVQLNENNPYLLYANSGWIPDLLQATIEASDADCGNVQLFDPAQHNLRIVAQRGFKEEFLTFFDAVHCGDGCACGAALAQRSRIVVTDVRTDALFQAGGSKDVMLRAKAISCQSTPLIDPVGNIIGMVSTHYGRPGGPTARVWTSVDQIVADHMARINSNTLDRPPSPAPPRRIAE